MSAVSIAFFNNKGGVGKTSLVYHLAWMFADREVRVLAADLDPQANLSAALLTEDRLEELWGASKASTIFSAVQPLMRGVGDIEQAYLEEIDDNLSLLVGDLSLSAFEDQLSSEWSGCLDRKELSFRVISAFWRVLQASARRSEADVLLIDLGPSLGAINRAAMLAADFVAVPVAPDLFSLQGLRNLGPTLRRWREEWQDRLQRKPALLDLDLPGGDMCPAGYIVLQHAVRLDRPVAAYDRWARRIPEAYRTDVLDQPHGGEGVAMATDPNCLGLLKHYRSLMPMAQEARKPIFHLKPADGAIGAHTYAVHEAGKDFSRLSSRLAEVTGISIPVIP